MNLKSKIYIEELNASWYKIHTKDNYAYHLLNQEFSYFAPGFRYTTSYKRGLWDGKIYALKQNGRIVPCGLISRVQEFLTSKQYETVINPIPTDRKITLPEPISSTAHAEQANVPEKYTIRTHQDDAVQIAIKSHKALFVSPTGSGKSLSIYLLGRLYPTCTKKLLVVPTKALVEQMTKDFRDYGYKSPITKIYGEMDKAWKEGVNTEFTICTWQSIHRMPQTWFTQYGVLLGDEAHEFKADSLLKISDKLRNAWVRYGFTATLDSSKCNRMVLEGIFGPVHRVAKTSDLQRKGELSPVQVKVVMLRHSVHDLKQASLNGDYQKELAYLSRNKLRRSFLVTLLDSLKGNTLLLFQLVNDLGIPLYDLAKQKGMNNVHLIHGKSKVEDREKVRDIIEHNDNTKVIASYGVFSRGVNVPRVDNIILGSSYKSEIKVLQSIGRGLRIGGINEVTCIYDIADDLRALGGVPNHSYRHAGTRLGYYKKEEFPYTISEIDLKGEPNHGTS